MPGWNLVLQVNLTKQERHSSAQKGMYISGRLAAGQVYGAFRGNGADRRLKQEVAGVVAGHAARGAATRV